MWFWGCGDRLDLHVEHCEVVKQQVWMEGSHWSRSPERGWDELCALLGDFPNEDREKGIERKDVNGMAAYEKSCGSVVSTFVPGLSWRLREGIGVGGLAGYDVVARHSISLVQFACCAVKLVKT